jgi:hypothetical protein
MSKQTAFFGLVAILGFVAQVYPGVTYAQVVGAVQYPPPSVGEDAQPPPPARMVPKTALPRRLEMGTSGSSLAPTDPPYRRNQDGVWVSMQPTPFGGMSPVPPPAGSGGD